MEIPSDIPVEVMFDPATLIIYMLCSAAALAVAFVLLAGPRPPSPPHIPS